MTKLNYQLDTKRAKVTRQLTVSDKLNDGTLLHLKDIVDGYLAARDAGYHVDDAVVLFRDHEMVLVWED